MAVLRKVDAYIYRPGKLTGGRLSAPGLSSVIAAADTMRDDGFFVELTVLRLSGGRGGDDIRVAVSGQGSGRGLMSTISPGVLAVSAGRVLATIEQ
jgi:hypothetical protein